MTNTNPHQGHRKRVRERIMAEGLSNFQPHEILEFLLFHTVAQKDTNLMAHRLIDTFGSLENVLDASPEELIKKGKLSENSAIFLSSLTDIFSYYEKCQKEKTPVNTTEKLVKLFKPYFTGQTKERLIVTFLDSGLRVKITKEMAFGQENGVHFNTKEILHEALMNNAYCVAIAHNHPVTSCAPSKNDINATSELKNRLALVDIKLIDHVIFGTDNFFSFAAHNSYCVFVSGGSNNG